MNEMVCKPTATPQTRSGVGGCRYLRSPNLLLLDRFAGPVINSFPFFLLFLAWPTVFMMWMVSRDWFGFGIAVSRSLRTVSCMLVLAGFCWR
jgi:hypothetical protein